MNLKDIRDYYGNMSKVAMFMNFMLMVILSGISIYVADIIASSTDEQNAIVYSYYTVFVIGAVVLILDIIALLMGRKGEYESAFKFRRFLSVVGAAVSVVSLYASISVITGTYKEWDGDVYTIVIFSILLAAGILSLIYNVICFYVSFMGAKYYDSKQVAKDIPENMTQEKCSKKKELFTALTYSVSTIGVSLMFLYFSKEIERYEKIKAVECGIFKDFYLVQCIVLIVATVILLAVAIGNMITKSNNLEKMIKISYLVNLIIQMIFVVFGFISMTQDFVKASYPDVTYIVFTMIIVVISEMFVLPGMKKNSK